MPRPERHLALSASAAGVVAALLVAPAGPAMATETASLHCGSRSYIVDGFGRGQVLHVTGTTQNFIVTRAVRADGTVAFDSPAQADRPVVTCTTTTPEGTWFAFTGFFTPPGELASAR